MDNTEKSKDVLKFTLTLLSYIAECAEEKLGEYSVEISLTLPDTIKLKIWTMSRTRMCSAIHVWKGSVYQNLRPRARYEAVNKEIDTIGATMVAVLENVAKERQYLKAKISPGVFSSERVAEIELLNEKNVPQSYEFLVDRTRVRDDELLEVSLLEVNAEKGLAVIRVPGEAFNRGSTATVRIDWLVGLPPQPDAQAVG